MEESGTARMQLTSDTHHSSASLSKAEANADSSLSSKCSCKKLSKVVGKKHVQNDVVSFEQCPEGHICYKCSSGLFADSSIFYGAQDYVTGYTTSLAKTRSTYNTERVVDQSGADLRGNIWLGSYHY